MILDRSAPLGFILAASLSFAVSHTASGQSDTPKQDDPGQSKPKVISASGAGTSIEAIHEEYNRQLLQLEKQRLERLRQLASRQAPKDADETYELLFRLAISNNLFREAEPVAQQVIKGTTVAPQVRFLAQAVDIIASADQGNFDDSLAELRRLFDSPSGRSPRAQGAHAALDTRGLLTIFDAYYQRLLQGDRFDIARSAFQVVLKETENPSIKGYCAARLNQLDLIGKPAPAIQGSDLDGKPVDLAAMKGNVVLVVFWASWCVSNSAEVVWLDQIYTSYQGRGFRILGINLDTLQKDGPKLETVMPNIKRFLLDHNVRWPNLINGPGAQDYAKAYGVAEIPTNVLIGRDGNVIHLDLSRKNLDSVVARSLAP